MTDPVSGNGQPDGLPPRATGRRRSLIFLVVLLLGLPLAFVVRSALDDGWREVASIEALEENDVIYVPAANVFLVYHEPPLALRAVISHLGEPIAYCRESSTFMELAHGSKWDRLGYYMDGPAPRGMDSVASRVVDGVVEIMVTDITEGPRRGAGPRPEVTGPFCIFEEASDATNGFLEPPPPLPA